MNRLRMFLKRILTPVTILLVPHSRTRSVSIRVPVVAVAASIQEGNVRARIPTKTGA